MNLKGTETQFYFGKSIVNLINGGSFYKCTNDDEFLKAQPMVGYFLVCCLVRILGTTSAWRKFLLCSWASSLVRRQTGITETFAPFLLLLDTLALNLHRLDYYSLCEDIGPRASPLPWSTVRGIAEAFAHFLLLFGTLR